MQQASQMVSLLFYYKQHIKYAVMADKTSYSIPGVNNDNCDREESSRSVKTKGWGLVRLP